jgi:hypothetical protein
MNDSEDRMGIRRHFLNAVEDFRARHGIKKAALGASAVARPEIIGRIARGGPASLATLERIEAWMDGYQPPPPKSGRRKRSSKRRQSTCATDAAVDSVNYETVGA